jgi:hypothetical protein
VPIRYVLEARPGISHARNTGVASAAGRYVAFGDSGTTGSGLGTQSPGSRKLCWQTQNSYPEMVNANGHWVTPTAAPVQFDPEPLKASVARLLARETSALCVTHYGRVPYAPHLGPLLLSQIDEMAAIGKRLRDAPERHTRLREAFVSMYCHRLAEHGFTDVEARLPLMAMDVELNAQGLACWLDRKS